MTNGDFVCNVEINRNLLTACNNEKADTRMFVHTKHASTGSRVLSIVSSDSDVVVLAEAAY